MNQKRDIDNRMQLTKEKSNYEKSNNNINNDGRTNNSLLNTNSSNQFIKSNY